MQRQRSHLRAAGNLSLHAGAPLQGQPKSTKPASVDSASSPRRWTL